MSDPALEVDQAFDAQNIRAVAAIYFGYALEELRLFHVVDRLAQLFAQGLLPIGDARTKEALLSNAFRNERLSGQERRSLYFHALGVSAADARNAKPNREFLARWMRFLVEVAAYAERHPAADALAPPSTSNGPVRAAARALAANVSACGGEPTRTTAAKLLAQMHAAIDVLDSPDLRNAYRARDAWQLIDLVNRAELGGPRDVARYCTQAHAGSQVLSWLADHAELLDDDAKAAAHTVTPDGQALVDAVAQLLGVIEGSAGADVEPSDPAAMEAQPRIDLPEPVRRLLETPGVPGPRAGDERDALPRPGVVTVFQGGRHAGKTLAAYRAAKTLGTDVHRVDLSQVVGKYIGETEKNLDAVFRRAEDTGALLLIEEADALFARRSEVKDAHDRYANVDVERLLQRMEKHRAPVIVETRRKQNIDPAFLRRLRFVTFPSR